MMIEKEFWNDGRVQRKINVIAWVKSFIIMAWKDMEFVRKL